MDKQYPNSLGCELSKKGRGNLRIAIKTMLLVAMTGLSYASDISFARTNDLETIEVHPDPYFPDTEVISYPDWDPYPEAPDFSDSWDGFIENTSDGSSDGGSGPDEIPDQICPTRSNPIVLATGNKIEPETDFTSSGEMGLGLQRTYNHYWKGAGLFGKHWVSNFDYKLTFGSTDLNSCYPRPGGWNLRHRHEHHHLRMAS